jgi:hypothetical protein
LEGLPLHKATFANNFEMTKKLVAAGADAAIASTSRTPLIFHALLNHNLEMAKFLLKHGANPKQHNELALGLAVVNSDYDFVHLLVQIGGNVNLHVSPGIEIPNCGIQDTSMPLLDVAVCCTRHDPIVRFLVTHNATIEASTLKCAAHWPTTAILKFLFLHLMSLPA